MPRKSTNDYGYIPDDGYIPDEIMPESAAAFDALAGKYDASGTPAVTTWESFRPEVEKRAEEFDAMRKNGYLILWWIIAKVAGIPLWRSNQSNIGSCAGWSAGGGYMMTVLYQMFLGAFRFTPVNPLAMWLVTKNWSRSGGQSMSNVLIGGNRHGNWPVEIVGCDPLSVNKNMVLQSANVASLLQFGACRLPGVGRALATIIILCLRAGFVVCIGNSVKVSGARTNAKGLRQAILGGTWAHATVFDGYIVVDGEVFLHWTNSHGDRYKGADRFDSPESGCWFSVDQVIQFCSGRYVDAFAITYSEAEVDTERKSLAPLPIYAKAT